MLNIEDFTAASKLAIWPGQIPPPPPPPPSPPQGHYHFIV